MEDFFSFIFYKIYLKPLQLTTPIIGSDWIQFKFLETIFL